jgi:hypothetical protein
MYLTHHLILKEQGNLIHPMVVETILRPWKGRILPLNYGCLGVPPPPILYSFNAFKPIFKIPINLKLILLS